MVRIQLPQPNIINLYIVGNINDVEIFYNNFTTTEKYSLNIFVLTLTDELSRINYIDLIKKKEVIFDNRENKSLEFKRELTDSIVKKIIVKSYNKRNEYLWKNYNF